MEDSVNGAFGDSSVSVTPVAMISPVLVDEDSPGTPSSINTEWAKGTKAKKSAVNQSIVWEHFKKVDSW
jgi:hypothetical protein